MKTVIICGLFDVVTAELVEIMEYFSRRYNVVLVVKEFGNTINNFEDRLMVASAFGYPVLSEEAYKNNLQNCASFFVNEYVSTVKEK